jgi:hypothetical protein
MGPRQAMTTDAKELKLQATPEDHRRVLAVLAFLRS